MRSERASAVSEAMQVANRSCAYGNCERDDMPDAAHFGDCGASVSGTTAPVRKGRGAEGARAGDFTTETATDAKRR